METGPTNSTNEHEGETEVARERKLKLIALFFCLRPQIPTGLRHSAQGCNAAVLSLRRYPGETSHSPSTLKVVASPFFCPLKPPPSKPRSSGDQSLVTSSPTIQCCKLKPFSP